MINKWTPITRRVRLYQNPHGAYIFQQLIRSHSHPSAHWGPGLGSSKIVRPPRVQRTNAQVHAFMKYIDELNMGYDFYH